VTDPHEALVAAALTPYAPDVLVGSIVRRVFAAARSGAALDRRRLLDELRSSVRLFLEPTLQNAALRAIEAIGDPSEAAPTRAELVSIRDESDVCRARIRAREIALILRTNAFGAQRASTAVSELARNMILYAAGGTVELVPSGGRPPRLTVRANDKGPGIPDVTLALSGKFRSATGLGRGLAGVKRLASRFEIKTGPTGTSVEAVIDL
jgi:serine/threonine-protein kinase RsbT